MSQQIDPLRVLAMSLLAYNTPESAGSATVDGTIKIKDVEDQTRVFHLAQLLADTARQGLCVVPAATMQYMTVRLARLETLHGARRVHTEPHVHTQDCYKPGAPCGMAAWVTRVGSST
jgi:hypothetical protein